MKYIQKILVPVDLGESSIRLIETAIVLAKSFSSSVMIMHVDSSMNISNGTKSFLTQAIQSKLSELAEIVKSEQVDLCEVIIEKGVPFEKIIHIAQSKDVNVIITGAGSKIEQGTIKLGTTVEKIMHRTMTPLWVVKNEDVIPIKKIICPVDFSDASKRALYNAITIASKLDAELTVLNVFKPVQQNYSLRYEYNIPKENKLLWTKQNKEFKEFLQQFNFKSITYHTKIVSGEPVLEIINLVKTEGFDLLLMGTTGKTGLSKLVMGSVTQKVTRELPCNFIITRNKDITKEYFENNLKTLESVINTARDFYKKGEIQQAIEKYTAALQQYPDNIPIIIGLVNCFKAIGDKKNTKNYKDYAREVVIRIFGDEYLSMIEVLLK